MLFDSSARYSTIRNDWVIHKENCTKFSRVMAVMQIDQLCELPRINSNSAFSMHQLQNNFVGLMIFSSVVGFLRKPRTIRSESKKGIPFFKSGNQFCKCPLVTTPVPTTSLNILPVYYWGCLIISWLSSVWDISSNL